MFNEEAWVENQMTATPIEKANNEWGREEFARQIFTVETEKVITKLLEQALHNNPQAAAALDEIESIASFLTPLDERKICQQVSIVRRALRPATQTQGDDNE